MYLISLPLEKPCSQNQAPKGTTICQETYKEEIVPGRRRRRRITTFGPRHGVVFAFFLCCHSCFQFSEMATSPGFQTSAAEGSSPYRIPQNPVIKLHTGQPCHKHPSLSQRNIIFHSNWAFFFLSSFRPKDVNLAERVEKEVSRKGKMLLKSF